MIARLARRLRLAVAVVVSLTIGATPVVSAADEPGPRTRRAAAVLSDGQQRAGHAWQVAAVHHPVEVPPSGVPEILTRLPAPEPGQPPPLPGGRQVRGAVKVGPRTAAMVRVEALAVARVRRTDGSKERLRFHRVSGEGGGAWAAAAEGPMELTPGTWLLEQPPGGPSYWLVTAPTAVQIVIETAAPRTGDLIWEHASAAVLAWIDEGGPVPPLPATTGVDEATRELLADAEIAAEIERLDPKDTALKQALRAWRAASAIQRLAALRRPIRPAFALELDHRALPESNPLPGLAGWRRVRGPRQVVWSLTGPGVLWVEARSVGAGQGAISVRSAGRRLGAAPLLRPVAGLHESEDDFLTEETGAKGQADMSQKPAAKPEAPSNFGGGLSGEDVDLGARPADGAGPDDRIGPRLAAVVGAPVGPRGALRIPLAPGRHDYRIDLAGADAVTLLRVGRSNDRLADLARGESVAGLLRRGRRALADSNSERAVLVDALLAAVEGGPVRDLKGGDASPVLALARLCLAAQAADLEPAERIALARSIARRIGKQSASPLVWRARQLGLDLLEGTGESALARQLIGPRPADAPPEVLERLARQIAGPALAVRSPAVALLELARRRAPLDPRLRAVYRDQWRAGTRWAALRADEAAGAAWTWIEPWSPTDDRTPGTRALWRWPNGESRRLAAAVSHTTPGRAALLRMYMQVPVVRSDFDPLRDAGISLAVDDRQWHGLALGPIESWRVALPPGEHRVRLSAPRGSTVWSSLPPDDGGAPEGHLLRMWPAVGGASLRFLLPAGAEPGYVRIEARALADHEGPQRARVYVARDDGPERAVDLWLPPTDAAIVPVEAPIGVGPRAGVIVGIGPDTRAVWVRVAEGAPRLAISASIRSTRDTGSYTLGHDDAAAPTGDATGSSDEQPLERLTRLSRAIQDRPDDLGLRLARAELLLDLDQPGYAFVDWRMVTAGKLSRALTARATGLAERLDALDAPDSLDINTDAPVLVAPALAAAIGPAAGRRELLAPAITAARLGGPSMGLRALDRLGLDDEQRWRAVGGPADPRALDAGPGDMPEKPGAKPGPGDMPEKPAGAKAGATRPTRPADAAAKPGPGDMPEKPGGKTSAPKTGAAAQPGPGDMPEKPGAASGTPETSGSQTALPIKPPARRSAAAPLVVSEPVGALIAAAVLRATWLDAQAQPAAAARIWARLEARTGLWQAGLMGVRSFLHVLDVEPPAGTAPPIPVAEGSGLAYGLALSLRRTVRTPSVQRLATVAATRSRWSRIEGAERDAGSEGLRVPRAPALPSPNAAVRQALVVPPWDPVDATLLRPGYATVLDLKRTELGALAVDLWCQTVRPDLSEGGLPHVKVTLDGATLFDESIIVEQVAGTSVEGLPEGRHRLEVALDAASRAQLCSVRLRDDAGAVGSLRPTRWQVARPKQPVEVVVLGPTSLAVEARVLAGRGAAAQPTGVAVAVAQGDGPFTPRGQLALPAELDPRATPETTRTIAAGQARTEVLALPEPGPQRVLLRPDGGAVLLRLQQRLDGDPTPVPRPPIRALDLGALVDPVAPIGYPRTDVPPIASPPVPQRFGTVWGEVRGGLDDLEDSDDLRPRSAVRVRLGWARELIARRLWLNVAPELRARESTALAGGGTLALQATFPRAGLRTRLSGAFLSQNYAGDQGFLAEGALYIDRLTWVAPRWQLVPSLDLRYRHQSLSPAWVASVGDPVHPRIFNQYVADHPLALRPGLEVRWQPLQDARLFVATDLVPNSNFRGLDQWNLRGGLLGAVALLRRVVPEYSLAYEASLRLADADRSDFFVQHRLHAGLGVGVWAGQAARFVVGVGDTLYAAAPFPLRNVVEAWLRVDLVFGRALRDYGPLDMSFRPVREHRLWAGEGGAR